MHRTQKEDVATDGKTSIWLPTGCASVRRQCFNLARRSTVGDGTDRSFLLPGIIRINLRGRPTVSIDSTSHADEEILVNDRSMVTLRVS